MRPKQPLVKKHIHSWKLSDKKLAPSGWYLQRVCGDFECRVTQSGYLEHEVIREIPGSLVHLADTSWTQGSIADVYPDVLDFISYFHGVLP